MMSMYPDLSKLFGHHDDGLCTKSLDLLCLPGGAVAPDEKPLERCCAESRTHHREARQRSWPDREGQSLCSPAPRGNEIVKTMTFWRNSKRRGVCERF